VVVDDQPPAVRLLLVGVGVAGLGGALLTRGGVGERELVDTGVDDGVAVEDVDDGPDLRPGRLVPQEVLEVRGDGS
jgi:hypothetical protein